MGDLCPGGLCLGWSQSRGSLSGGLYPGRYLSRGDLSPGGSLSGGLFPEGISVQGISVQVRVSVRDPDRDTPRTVKSGRYASYWNAFLVSVNLVQSCGAEQMIKNISQKNS